jgi:hypothetical protein
MTPGPNVSALLLYAKVFLIAGTAMGLFFHAVTKEPMPWWPDTAMIGTFMGAMAVLITAGYRRDRRFHRRVRDTARLARLWWRTRNTV